jgi:hypothetical protein
LKSWIRTRCRPSRSIDLLVRANLAPFEKAVEAWRAWQSIKSIEDATWSESRLLAPLARRIASLDPGFPYQKRLEGVAKSQWTRTQLTIRDSVPALDVLRNAGIDHLVFKGGAYHAEGPSPSTCRIMGDVDILILPGTAAAASEHLSAAGWATKSTGKSVKFLRQVRIGVNFWKDEFGAIDVHHQVFHFSRRDPALDAELWENAKPARLSGRPVLIPSLEDSIVIGIAHGIRGGEGDWAVDLGHRIRQGQIQWSKVSLIAERRGLVPHVMAGLMYMRLLDVEVPEATLEALSRAHPTAGEYLKYLSDTLRRENTPSGVRRMVDRIANKMLPRHEYPLDGLY